MVGLNVEMIAEKLGRHRSTVFREIKLNTVIDSVMPELNGYYCVTAHDMCLRTENQAKELARLSNVRQSVIDRLIHGWSPQQIAGRMRLEQHPVFVTHDRRARKWLSRDVDPLSVADADVAYQSRAWRLTSL